MKTTKIWYNISNGGDGSASLRLYDSERLAQITEEWDFEDNDDKWAEPSIDSFDIEYNGTIYVKVKTPASLINEMEKEIKKSYYDEEEKEKMRDRIEMLWELEV